MSGESPVETPSDETLPGVRAGGGLDSRKPASVAGSLDGQTHPNRESSPPPPPPDSVVAEFVIPANAGISEPDPEPESGTVLIPAHDGSSPPVELVETPAHDLDKLDQRSSSSDDLDTLEQRSSDTLDQRSSDEPDQPAFRRGVRLALDWGKARIGVASCDPDGTLAYPVETVQTHQAARRLPQLLAEYEPIEVIVGLPRTLAGDEGPAAGYVRAQVASLIAANPQVSWRFSDERLTTVDASRRLRSAGRDAKRQRAVIDQAAAVAILEQALATERATGAAPGEPA